VVTVSRNLNSVTPVLEMPFWLFFAPLVLGSLLLVIETIAGRCHPAVASLRPLYDPKADRVRM